MADRRRGRYNTKNLQLTVWRTLDIVWSRATLQGQLRFSHPGTNLGASIE